MVKTPLLYQYKLLLLLGVVFERRVARIPLVLGSCFLRKRAVGPPKMFMNLGVEQRVQKLKV